MCCFKVSSDVNNGVENDVNNEPNLSKESLTPAHIEGFVEGGPAEQTLQSHSNHQALEGDEVIKQINLI